MSATASETDKYFFMACYSLPRVRSYIPLVVSSPIDIEVMTSPRADWELPNPIIDSPASPDADGATEPEASSLKLDGNADPEFCGYGVRASRSRQMPTPIRYRNSGSRRRSAHFQWWGRQWVIRDHLPHQRQSGPGRRTRTTTTPTASAGFWTTVLMRPFVT